MTLRAKPRHDAPPNDDAGSNRAGPATGRESVDRSKVLEQTQRHVNRTLARLAGYMNTPVEVYSEGAWVHDENGETYLDCAGYAVFLHGHRHPQIVAAVRQQLDTHPLASRILLNPNMAQAAEALARISPRGLEYVLFANSGAEAVEAALKLACANGKTHFISAEAGFHGKTAGALSVTGRTHYRTPFRPLLAEVEFVPFNDLAALEQALRAAPGQACLILEPIQAEAGVILPAAGYLRGVRTLCDRYGALFIADEIQTGLGRTGRRWAVDREDVIPDILLVGKALSGGVVPVAALVATPAAFAPFNRDPFLHTSTFAGSPLATAAALAAIRVLDEEGLAARAGELGTLLGEGLRDIFATACPHLVREVRYAGLLIGIDCDSSATAGRLMLELVRRRLLVCHSHTAQNVVRLTPPAVLNADDCSWLFSTVRAAAAALAAFPAQPASVD